MQSKRRLSRPDDPQPVLITSARWSRPDEIRHREHRYLMAMLVRIVVFLVAAVALPGWTRFLGMVAAIFIPWLAVLYANTGPLRGRDGRPSLYTPDASTLPADPYPLAEGQQTIVNGEWTHSGRQRAQSRRDTDLPARPSGLPAGGHPPPSAPFADHEGRLGHPYVRRPGKSGGKAPDDTRAKGWTVPAIERQIPTGLVVERRSCN